jgi:hypothetical protein
MTAIAPTTTRPSRALLEAMRQHQAGYTTPAAQHVRDEAARNLPAMQRALGPADASAWRQFLRPLVASVRNPPPPEAEAAFGATCAAVLRDIPACVLTAEAQRDACRRFAFWPAVADLDEWLRPYVAPLRADLAAMRRIAAEPAATAPKPMSDEERERASAQLQQLAAELRRQDQQGRPKPRGTPMRPADLAAAYRADAERVAEQGRADLAAAFRARAERIEGAHV